MEDYQQHQEEIVTESSLVKKNREDLSEKRFSRLANLSVDTKKTKGVSISGKISGISFYVPLLNYGDCKYLGSFQRIISEFQDGVMANIDNCDSTYEFPFNLLFFPESKTI